MRVTTKVSFDIETGKLIEWEGYEYEGPIAHLGSGPSPEQKAAAASQAAANQQNSATQQEMLGLWKDQYARINPYATALLQKGLPFLNNGNLPYLPALLDMKSGITARTNASARANLLRSIGGFDSAMPNGFKAQLLADQSNSAARDQASTILGALDANMQAQLLNQNAKMQAAGIMAGQQNAANPLGWAGAVTQGNNAIMQAPLQSTSPWATVGGMAAGLGSAALKQMKPWGF
jgi:hypothetical protein